MGGAWFQDVFSQSPADSEVEQTALDAVGHSLGIKQNPTMCHVSICKVCKHIKPSCILRRQVSNINLV